MKILFVAPLQSIDIEESGRGFQFADDVFVTSDRDYITKLITPRFRELAGQLDTRALETAPAVLHRVIDYSGQLDVQSAFDLISTFLGAGQQMLMSLWLVKDNAVMLGDGYMEFPYRSDGDRRIDMVKHNLALYYWDARIDRINARFSTDDLRQARHYLHTFTPRIGAPHTGEPQATLPAQTPRVARVWYFTENARMASDLAVKIATYITALEALLSTDSQELSHKLSERLARFLGGSSEDQRKIYGDTKNAYAVRSRTVHGDELSKKQLVHLADTSSTLDQLLRRALRQILASPELIATFNSGKDRLEEYVLNELLFPAHVSPPPSNSA